MKKTKLFIGALSLLAFAACSDDKVADAPQQVLNDGSESFIKVRVLDVNSLGGRAENDFENGNTDGKTPEGYDESAITSLLIAFYDNSGNFIALSDKATTIDITAPNQSDGSNIETIAEITVKVKLKPESPIPSYAIAFANPIDGSTSLSSITATRMITREKTYSSATVNDKNVNVFAMNNSVYFDTDGNEIIATPVSSKNFYKGDNSGGVPAVDFYIERIAGKVILKSNDSSDASKLPITPVSGDLTTSEKTPEKKYFVFVPEKWYVNAEEQKTNLMKTFGTADYNTLNNNLQWGSGVKWNDPDNKRSYWVRSLTWGDPKIPIVSDDVVGNETIYSLTYHSFEYISKNGVSVNTPVYTFENTKQSTNYNNNAALVSAVVIGHYEIRDTETATSGSKETFYRRNGQFFTIDGYYSYMTEAQHLLGTLSDDGNKFTALDATALKSITDIVHPVSRDAENKYVENEVTLQINRAKALKTSDLVVRTAENTYTKYSELSEEWNDTKINKELMTQCGRAEAYTEGKAYFNIPIRHLGRETTNEGKTTLSAGYYGIVRNHTYEITVTGMAEGAFGHGIFDEKKPIVPPTETDEYNFKANMNVHAWRMVRHNVTLK